jgi:CBS domain containing-hemolysin-like protein
VPEKKKIDDLFRDFQKKHTHIAVVVDEYGGCSGLITLEDVLEEIVGEINDEYDEVEESQIKQIAEGVYLCEARVLLHDLSRQTGLDLELFEDYLSDADTLAGLVLEIAGKFPEIGEEIQHANYRFFVTDADDRRIKTIRLEVPNESPGDGMQETSQDV